jgi:hypothetical protein
MAGKIVLVSFIFWAARYVPIYLWQWIEGKQE